MSSMTHATQQAVVAAAARPCADAARGYLWNGAVGMTMGSHIEFASDIATKRPARHLGDRPT